MAKSDISRKFNTGYMDIIYPKQCLAGLYIGVQVRNGNIIG